MKTAAAASPEAPDSQSSFTEKRRHLAWMFGFLRPVWRLAVAACLWQMLWVGLEILVVRQTARSVNEIKLLPAEQRVIAAGFWDWLRSGDANGRPLRDAILILAMLAAALALLQYLREVAFAKLSMNKVFHIREAVYDRLQRLGQAFHDVHSTGELINRAFNDLQNIRAFIQSSLLLTLEIVLIVSGYFALLLSRSPWLAALALAPLPIWGWYTVRFSRRVQPLQRGVMDAADRNVAILSENISGVHVVRAFATEQQEIDKYARSCDDYRDRVLRRIRLYANYTPVIRAISLASHLSLFLAAGMLVIRGALQAGDVLILGSAMGAILARLQQIAVINDNYQNAIVSAGRLREVLDAADAVPESASDVELPPGGGAVRFEGVTFGYDPARPVLHAVSFETKAGQTVALVGPTGAGKSTLVQLLARLYDPQSGRILIDGVDVRDVPLRSLRRQIAIVFQETVLFSETVEHNIAYGRPEWCDGRVEAASRLAQAQEFIDALPRGLKTTIGERGATLSGGQRQRLAIARAVHSDPRILILDDATASVDPETEELIQSGMRESLSGRTVFVISHRISTVRRADLVIVLENGRVTQMGTHAELLARDGHYREIAAHQLADDLLPPRHLFETESHLDRVRDDADVRLAQAAGRSAEEEAEKRP
ncbi:MAG: ABC transporter ATP-binding protein [Planctomycetes bacterium]|nr:ABC transporter ATP-binding protein [Planctomycetota bacterium]